MVELVSWEMFFPHSDPAPCAGKTFDRVGQGQELLVERVVELARELLHPGGSADQVRSTDVADEERVAGQHRVRDFALLAIDDHDRDRFRRVTGRLEKTQRHAAQA